MTTHAIHVRGLEKSYKDLKVLRGPGITAIHVSVNVTRTSRPATASDTRLATSEVSTCGLSASSPDGASAFAYPIIFLPFLSSAFVPTDTMPGPVRAFADNQPVTSIIDTIRDLFAQQPVGGEIWTALAWCLGVLAAAYALANAAYRRKIA
ncbi:ABC transporter permease [Spirillospora sp. NPDC052242]